MLGSRDRISLSRSWGHRSLFARARAAVRGYKLIDRQALLAFAREVSSVALSHLQQIATRVAVGAASTAALPGRTHAGPPAGRAKEDLEVPRRQRPRGGVL